MALHRLSLRVAFGVACCCATAWSQTTTLVSLSSSGVQANNTSFAPSISTTGRYVAFESSATNLVSGDTNGFLDVFMRDTQAGTTALASVDSSGAQGNQHSYECSISGDGRYVAFKSAATNLVPGDTNGGTDIFVRELLAGTTTRVSVNSSGVEGNGYSELPAISADGRYVIFDSDASNLVASDTNGKGDAFVHDRQTGATTRVSVDSSGAQGDDSSAWCAISGDGRYAAFSSDATNLVPGDTNSSTDVFVHDRQTGVTTRASVDSAGVEGTGYSFFPALSADGRYVAFVSAAVLVGGDFNGNDDIFVHDLPERFDDAR